MRLNCVLWMSVGVAATLERGDVEWEVKKEEKENLWTHELR